MNKHLFLPSDYAKPEPYTYPPRSIKTTPLRRDVDRETHGNTLETEYNNTAQSNVQYVDIILTNNGYRVLEKLEQGDNVRISHVQKLNDEKLKVTINKTARPPLLRKINEFLTKETDKGAPKNEDLISNITEIKSATLASFWAPDEYQKLDGARWEEIWLTTDNESIVAEVEQIAKSLGILTKREKLVFPDTTIKLIKADKQQLEALITKTSVVGEFRSAPTAISQYLKLNNYEMSEYVDDLLSRYTYVGESDVSVCILDAGITSGHPLLKKVIESADIYSLFEDIQHDRDYNGHGTAVAGLVVYGDLADAFESSETINIPHKLESVKLIRKTDPHEPELYGDFTKRAAYLPIISKPDRERIYYSTVTAPTDGQSSERPSSWSGAIDQLCIEDNKKLYIISSGNEWPMDSGYTYPSSNETKQIDNPAQAWNAVTVGAYTNKTEIIEEDYRDYCAVAPAGSLSPFSSTTALWANTGWPIKPEIVLEGGNIAESNNTRADIDDLKLLTTNHKFNESFFTSTHGTSAAAALAARYAAIIKSEYPDAWPETIRALLIHSASWTNAMTSGVSNKGERYKMMRKYGYGVPNLDKALACLNNSLTLISEKEIQPYTEGSSKPKMNEMDVYELPWPKDILQDLGETPVTMKVTLSYFVDPSPREIWNSKYQYQSCGLRFTINNPIETLERFKLRISKYDDEDGNRIISGTSSAADYWLIGDARNKGSIHSDQWSGKAIELASSNLIAVYPVTGWWKTLVSKNKFNSKCRYSLIVSIYTDVEGIDIYTPIKTEIDTKIATTISIDL